MRGMILGATPGVMRPKMRPPLPYAGGQFSFSCTLGHCIPQDGTALAAVMTLNKKLGRTSTPQAGIDMAAVHLVNARNLPGLRPFVSTADLARHLGAVVVALTRMELTGYAGGGALGDTAIGIALGATAAQARPSASARAAFEAARMAAVPPNKPAPAQVRVTPKVSAEPTATRVRLTKAQIIRLQRALRAVKQKVTVDGKLGPQTLTAVRNWQVARGRISEVENTTYETIAVFYDALMERLTATASPASMPTASRSARPTAEVKRPPSVETKAREVVLPKGAAPVGDFSCKAGVCTAMSDQAAKTAIALQSMLLAFPPAVVRAFPAKFRVDGKLGPHTVQAVVAVLRAAAKREGRAIDEKELATLREAGAEGVAKNIDQILSRVTAEQKLQALAAAQGEQGGPGLTFKILKNGTAAGNEAFRCYSMALQVQLNRMGQRLGVDGVVGRNTVLSVNAVFGAAAQAQGKPWRAVDVRGIAEGLQTFISTAKTIADKAGAPAPDPRTMRAAIAKCRLETKQPVVDSRLFRGEPVVTPTAPPPPAPAPTVAQPVPRPDPRLAPNPIAADVDALKQEAVYRGLAQDEADAIAEQAVRAGANRPQLVAAFNTAIARKDAARDQYSAPAPTPPPNTEPRIIRDPGPPQEQQEEQAGEPAAPEPAAPQPTPPPEPAPPPAAAKDRTWQYILGGLAGLGVLTGGVGIYLATRKKGRR